MESSDCSAGALRRAAVCGTLAASIYNTQPWRFRLTSTTLQLYSDPERQLRAHDPDGRLLMMSCGCALLNARVSLASEGVAISVRRSADVGDATADGPRLLATATVAAQTPPEGSAITALMPVLDTRRTNRHRFTDDDVPASVLTRLQEAAQEEGAVLLPLSAEQRRIVREFVAQARAVSYADPSRRAERRAWSATAGYPPPSSHDPPAGGFLALVCARTDTPVDWLRAGEALERVLLDLTRTSLRATMSSDIGQVPDARDRLQTALGLSVYPLLLLGIGHAPPGPATRRRRLVDVIIDPSADQERLSSGLDDLGVI